MHTKDVEKLIEHWVLSSDRDFKTMQHMIKSKDFMWCLFVGHLVIEKLLKALYVKEQKEHPPMIHDLLRLAQKSKVELSAEQQNNLDIITKFNIRARYDDYVNAFYKQCTAGYAKEWNENIKALRLWLKKKL